MQDLQKRTTIEDQLTRSSTSVPANYRASKRALSDAMYRSKISIVVEEVDESHMWLSLIKEKNLISNSDLEPTIKEAFELTAIFIATQKKVDARIKKSKQSKLQ